MIQKDWVLKQIESFANFIAKLIFNKDTTAYVLEANSDGDEVDRLYWRLSEMVVEGKINEAENLLFDEIDPANKKYLELAVDFYSKLNLLSDEYLEKHAFSREEIEEGLNSAAAIFNVAKI